MALLDDAEDAEDNCEITGVCHVEKGAGSISLYSHVFRPSKTGQRNESTGFGDLRLVVVCRMHDMSPGFRLITKSN